MTGIHLDTILRTLSHSLCSAFVVGGMFLVESLSAQTPPPPEAVLQEAARFEQQQAAEDTAEQLERLDQLRGVAAANPDLQELQETDPDGFKLKIDKLTIEDNTLLPDEFIAKLIAENEGERLGLEEVNNILGQLTNEYVNRGYIAARAYLPPQDITSGSLTVTCVEGELTDFTGAIDPRNIAVKTAFPKLRGKVVNLRDLEQGIDQLNRLPSNQATLDIRPGDELGDSYIELYNTPGKRWRVIQGVNNGGIPSTGEYQSSTTVQIDNPLRINDQFSAAYSVDLSGKNDGGFSESVRASYSVPYGRWLFDASASYSTYSTETRVERFDFASEGDTWSFGLGGSYLIHRDQFTKSTLLFGLNHSITENFLNGNKLLASSRNITIGNIGFSHARPLKGGQLFFTFNYQRGLPFFNAFGPEDRIDPGQPDGDFDIWTADISYLRQFTPEWMPETKPITWSSSFFTHYTPDNVFASQQIGIGGQGSVRGFREENLLGQAGFFWRNELSWNLTSLAEPTQGLINQVNAFVAYDLGALYGPDRTDDRKGVIHGASAGIRFGGGKLNGEISVSQPVAAPDFIRSLDTLFYFGLSYTF